MFVYRLRESDTVRFLCYLNVTKAIIITHNHYGQRGRSVPSDGRHKEVLQRAERGGWGGRRKTGWHFSVSLLPLASVTNYYKMTGLRNQEFIFSGGQTFQNHCTCMVGSLQKFLGEDLLPCLFLAPVGRLLALAPGPFLPAQASSSASVSLLPWLLPVQLLPQLPLSPPLLWLWPSCLLLMKTLGINHDHWDHLG